MEVVDKELLERIKAIIEDLEEAGVLYRIDEENFVVPNVTLIEFASFIVRVTSYLARMGRLDSFRRVIAENGVDRCLVALLALMLGTKLQREQVIMGLEPGISRQYMDDLIGVAKGLLELLKHQDYVAYCGLKGLLLTCVSAPR
ncbi:MAG: hypothetical protein DRN15_11070 [Thermoprotei archaeon]|nr:MAG: hypothetical protein DRN15_11070 [Thermoprotei archaeon]